MLVRPVCQNALFPIVVRELGEMKLISWSSLHNANASSFMDVTLLGMAMDSIEVPRNALFPIEVMFPTMEILPGLPPWQKSNAHGGMAYSVSDCSTTVFND